MIFWLQKKNHPKEIHHKVTLVHVHVLDYRIFMHNDGANCFIFWAIMSLDFAKRHSLSITFSIFTLSTVSNTTIVNVDEFVNQNRFNVKCSPMTVWCSTQTIAKWCPPPWSWLIVALLFPEWRTVFWAVTPPVVGMCRISDKVTDF